MSDKPPLVKYRQNQIDTSIIIILNVIPNSPFNIVPFLRIIVNRDIKL